MARQLTPLLLLGIIHLRVTLCSSPSEQHQVNQHQVDSVPVVLQLTTHDTGSANSGSSDKNSKQTAGCSELPPNPDPLQPTLTCNAQCPICPTCPVAPVCPSPCSVCPTCPRRIPPGYEHFPGLGYYRLHVVPVNWMAAKETCEREGAHLAILNSQEEANLMIKLFNRDPNIGGWLLLGFHDLYEEGKYVTLFGQPLAKTGYIKWSTGQPDNYQKNENCGSMHPSGGLNDLNCSAKQPFVCELPI